MVFKTQIDFCSKLYFFIGRTFCKTVKTKKNVFFFFYRILEYSFRAYQRARIMKMLNSLFPIADVSEWRSTAGSMRPPAPDKG